MEKNRTSKPVKLFAVAEHLNLCPRIIVWIFACVAVCVLSVVTAFVVWSLIYYHDAVVSLQDRLSRVEKDCTDLKVNIGKIVDTRVQEILSQVS